MVISLAEETQHLYTRGLSTRPTVPPTPDYILLQEVNIATKCFTNFLQMIVLERFSGKGSRGQHHVTRPILYVKRNTDTDLADI